MNTVLNLFRFVHWKKIFQYWPVSTYHFGVTTNIYIYIYNPDNLFSHKYTIDAIFIINK